MEKQEQSVKAILVSIDTGEYDAEASLNELEELARTAGAETIAQVIQKRSAPDSATVVGEGKAAEIADICRGYEDGGEVLIIFDNELSASQIRNIEKITQTRVIDRTMLILDIFASRAVSGEGKLQVELAQLKYRLPRLSGLGLSLSRLGGGIGTRGPGETQLETDRRHIRRRIAKLNEELSELSKRREFSRARRKKEGVPVGAIVGYTNAGKSTLLNTLTDAGVLAQDKLFATLDLTSRAVVLPDGRNIILVDTVGLIRRLPHHLVEAFKSTLEEAKNADIIINVCDASDPEAAEKSRTTDEILAELGCSEIPFVRALNKCDLTDGKIKCGDDTVKISAMTGEGIPALLTLIAKTLPEQAKRMELFLPYDMSGLSAKIRRHGKIFSEQFENTGIRVDALVDIKMLNEAEPYVIPIDDFNGNINRKE